jgi:hypothetical protein
MLCFSRKNLFAMFVAALFVVGSVSQAEAVRKFLVCYDLIGGGSGALDSYSGTLFDDGSTAIVAMDRIVRHYAYDSSSTATEASPFIIAPDAGTGRWLLQRSESGFILDPSESDQGAATVSGDKTVKDLVDKFGANPGTITLYHNTGETNTTYTFDTSETIPANITLKIEPGARIARTTGDEVLTIYSTENLNVGSRQQITAVDMLAFTIGGKASPWWWGAVGDNSTDCTNAFTYAIGAVENQDGTWNGWRSLGTVYVPSGVYITDTLSLTKPVSLVGESEVSTQIKGKAGTTDEHINVTPSNDGSAQGGWPIAHFLFENIHFVGPGKADGGGASGFNFELDGSNPWKSRVRIQNCIVFQYANHGIEGTDFSGDIHIVSSTIRNNNNDGINWTGGYDLRLVDCEIGVNGRDGIAISGGNNHRAIGTYVYSNEQYGINLAEAQFSMIGGMIDNNDEHGLYYNNSYLNNLKHCVLTDVTLQDNSDGTADTYSDIYVVSGSNDYLRLKGCSFEDCSSSNPKYNIEFGGTGSTVGIADDFFDAGFWDSSVTNLPMNLRANSATTHRVETFDLADDAATSVTPVAKGGHVLISLDDDDAYPFNGGGLAYFDVGTNAACTDVALHGNAAVTTGALAGTTGSDGNLTLSSHTDGKLYIENRTGGSRKVTLIIFQGW